MLIDFTVENYKTFDAETSINMIASKKVRYLDVHCADVGNKKGKTGIKLLKTLALFGGNASGKSSLISAIKFVHSALTGSGVFCEHHEDWCKVKAENKDKASSFQIRFSVGDNLYVYGFSVFLSTGRVDEEFFAQIVKGNKLKYFFTRENGEKPQINEELGLTDEEKERVELNANVTFFYLLFLPSFGWKTFDEPSPLHHLNVAYDWLTKNIITDDTLLDLSAYTDEEMNEVAEAMEGFDVDVGGIKKYSVDKETVIENIGKRTYKKIVEHLTESREPQYVYKTDDKLYIFKAGSENNVSTYGLSFKQGFGDAWFDYSEISHGTRRLFDLMGILKPDREDVVYIVDDFGRDFHPLLSEHFLRAFYDKYKAKRVQFMFTTHEDNLLKVYTKKDAKHDKEFPGYSSCDPFKFRRDEIWFVERTFDGVLVYSLDRYVDTYDDTLRNYYLDERYGGTPNLGPICRFDRLDDDDEEGEDEGEDEEDEEEEVTQNSQE